MTNNREEQIYKAADKATYQTPPQYSELVHKSRKAMCAYEVGFIDGCVWADQHPHWIPVEERLPEDIGGFSMEVYVYCAERLAGRYGIAIYNYISNCWMSEYSDDEITHWMELPQQPRKEE